MNELDSSDLRLLLYEVDCCCLALACVIVVFF